MVFALTAKSVVFLILVAWELVWKGIALWKSAKQSQKWWYISMLILNTIGILPLVYLIFFQKEGAWINKIKARKSVRIVRAVKKGKKRRR